MILWFLDSLILWFFESFFPAGSKRTRSEILLDPLVLCMNSYGLRIIQICFWDKSKFKFYKAFPKPSDKSDGPVFVLCRNSYGSLIIQISFRNIPIANILQIQFFYTDREPSANSIFLYRSRTFRKFNFSIPIVNLLQFQFFFTELELKNQRIKESKNPWWWCWYDNDKFDSLILWFFDSLIL